MQTRAYAKLNLGLKIIGRRADGFHELRTVFQAVSLADDVAIHFGPGRGVRLEAAIASGSRAWARWLAVPAGSANLAFRAAELAREEFGLRGLVRVRLVKRIPVGAGLGGGSADAAAVLRLLAARARPAPPAAAIWRLAAALGSDVVPFLLGGTVLGLGRGDECYPLPDLPRQYAVLALPAMPVATATAFRLWDERHPEQGATAGLTPPDASATIYSFCGSLWRAFPASRLGRDRGRLRRSKVRAGIDNDFEEVVLSLSPDFAKIRRALRRSGAESVALTGSGAAQFGLFADRRAAQAARAQLGADLPAWVVRFVRRSEGWDIKG